ACSVDDRAIFEKDFHVGPAIYCEGLKLASQSRIAAIGCPSPGFWTNPVGTDDESWCSVGEMQRFDAAVLGLGTMGSFTCLELARQGLRVAGFDQFAPPHDRGSHSGDTRVFRIAYAEHPDYVPLAQRAALLWDQHGSDFGKTLLHRSGMLSAGPPAGELIAGI